MMREGGCGRGEGKVQGDAVSERLSISIRYRTGAEAVGCQHISRPHTHATWEPHVPA